MSHLSKQIALEVNEEQLNLAEVLRPAKLAGNLQFVHDAIDAALIRQAADERGIAATDDEIQHAADQFRTARELYDADTTEAWLAEHFLSYEDWEASLAQAVITQKLRAAVTAGQIEQHFATNRLTFDTAAVSHLVARDEDVARELLAQIKDDGADFHALARQHSLDAATRPAGGYAGVVRRTEMEADVEAAVFGAQPATVVGPFKQEHGWLLVKVEAQQRAALDDALRETITTQLFADWLAERRRKARVRLTLLEAVETEEAAGVEA